MTTYLEAELQNSTIVRTFEFPWHEARTPRYRRRGPVIRMMEAEDVPMVEAMSAALSARSLAQRFFVGTPQIPRALLRQLRAVDHVKEEAVIALIGKRAVGLAQYVRQADTDRADLAVLVVDAWQRHGIGRAMVTHLAELAAGRGITAFDADVLHDNEPARRAVGRLWPQARVADTEDCLEYQLPLAAARWP